MGFSEDLPGLGAANKGCFPLADSFPLMFHVTDDQGRIVRVSDLWLAKLGYSRDDVIGRRSLDFLTPDSARIAANGMDDFHARGFISDLRHGFRNSDGGSVDCVVTVSVLKSHDGKRIGAVAIVQGMEGPSEHIDRVKLESFRLKSCIEGTDAGTWEWNVQTGETVFNGRWAEIVGHTLDELSPISIDTWLTLAHPDDLALSKAALKDHWEGRAPQYDIQLRMRHRDGRWVWVHARGRVFTWTADGQPEWMFGTHFCIEESRRRAEESARLNRMLSRTGAVAGVGGWELDLETNKVIWSPETRRIHGVDDDFVPSVETGINFYAPEARDVIERAVQLGLEQGKPWDLVLPFTRVNGESIWVRAVGEVETERGTPRRIFGALQDITERVQQTNELQDAIDALERSNEELDQFAYIASHDLKAPLRVISNAVQWIEEDVGDALEGQTLKAMELLRNRVVRMDRLLSDLLEHSRIGRVEEDTCTVSIEEILTDIRDLVDLREGFRIESGPGLDEIHVPRMPATKILLNLVGNAVKHHDMDSGVVRIEAEETPVAWTFTVSDDGPGIPENMQERVFGMFQTLRPRDQVEGSGMGLAIIEKSVAKAGGRVKLTSEGRGCIFTIQLPRAAAQIERRTPA